MEGHSKTHTEYYDAGRRERFQKHAHLEERSR